MRTYAVVFAAGWLYVLGLLVGGAWAAESEVPGLLFSESFDDANLLQRGWYDGDRFKIVSQGAYAGTGAIEYRWQAGGTTPVSSSGIRRLFEPTDTVYLRYYIKLSPNWGWSGRPYHPHLILFLTTENNEYRGPANSHLTLYSEPVNGKLRLGATDMQNVDAPHGLTQGPLKGGYNGKLYDSAEVLFKDSNWHLVEAMFKLNSVDPAAGTWKRDGEVRGWFDGKLVIELTDVIFRTVDFPEMKFNQFLLTPYFGPGLLPRAQALWIDELAVGTQRIGPREKEAANPGPTSQSPTPKVLIVVAAGSPPPTTLSFQVDALSEPTSNPGNTYVFVEALLRELKALGADTQVLSYRQARDLTPRLPFDTLVFAGPCHNGELPQELQDLLPEVRRLSEAAPKVTYSVLSSAAELASARLTVTDFTQRLQEAGGRTVAPMALSATADDDEVQRVVREFASRLIQQGK